MELTSLPVHLFEIITNHKCLDQRVLCSVSKNFKEIVDTRAEKLRKLTYASFENEYFLLQELHDLVPLHDYSTIYVDGQEWYIDNCAWP